MQAFEDWEGDALEKWQSYVQSQFSEWAFTSKPPKPWTDPFMSATDSEHEQVGERNGSNGMIPSLRKMGMDGPSFQRWGITPLKTANTSSGITSPRFTISHLPPGWRCIRDQLTLDPVQNIIVRTRGLVYIGKRWHNPQPLSSRQRISLRGS